MSALCNGKVHREGAVWACICGHTSNAWDVRHKPMMHPKVYQLSCLYEALGKLRAAIVAMP